MHYDIIGDVHGRADYLAALLRLMDYEEIGGVWRLRDRMAIFVGDFIDRGPRQLESVRIVRRMVEAGSAPVVMGNHEFNAIAWWEPDPANPGDFLRSHRSPKYGGQHARFLNEAGEGSPLHSDIIEWFYTLPSLMAGSAGIEGGSRLLASGLHGLFEASASAWFAGKQTTDGRSHQQAAES